MTAEREVRYVRTEDGVFIAYQTVGDGPRDLVMVPGWISNLDAMWEWPGYARLLRRLASFSRLILFDKRGTGLSDRPTQAATLEERIDDLRAVLDATGSRRAALVGFWDGAAMCALFAASHPQRTTSLVLSGAFPRRVRTEEMPWLAEREHLQVVVDMIEGGFWGNGGMLPFIAPGVAGDERFRAWWARYERACASPTAAAALQRMTIDIDIRGVLPLVQAPTLVLQRERDPTASVESAQYVAEHVPGARLLVVPGDDALAYVGDTESLVSAIQEHVTGRPVDVAADRVLATVLFTDIVGSTELAAQLGDRTWRQLLDDHDAIVSQHVERARGRIIKSTGDGLLATFDGPIRAIHCAIDLRDDLRRIGLDVRTALHTGEVELRDKDVGGIAVHIAARILGVAGTGEVVVSRTVRDLVAGADVIFEERGAHTFKGVPDPWDVFAISA